MPRSKFQNWCCFVLVLTLGTTSCAVNSSNEAGSNTPNPTRPAATATQTPPTTGLGASAAPTSVAPTTTSTETTTSATVLTPSTTALAPSTTTAITTTTSIPAVAITRYGIPVRVSEANEDGWAVIDPCGKPKTVSKIFPIHNVEVVLDPGHGGKDPGTRGPTGLTESEINLEVAVAVSQILKQEGFSTFLTRSGDHYISLNERIALGDAANAAAFISIHHNAPKAAASKTPGTEVFAQSGDSESARLAGLLHQEVFDVLKTIDGVQWTSRWDAGALRVVNSEGKDAYSLVRKPETTNALIEIAYLASPSEGTFMAGDEYVPLVASPLAKAIRTFLTTNQDGTPLLERARIHNPSGGRTICPDIALE